jgi:hypothetical protein
MMEHNVMVFPLHWVTMALAITQYVLYLQYVIDWLFNTR